MNPLFYATPGDFLLDNREFLQSREACCQLNLTNAMANETAPCRPDLLFGAYLREGAPVLLFGHVSPWNLCLDCVPGQEAAALEAAKQLGGYLQNAQPSLSGVNAPSPLCQPFLEAYGKPYVLRTQMDILVLRHVNKPAPIPGRLCQASEEDVPLLCRWHQAFHEEAVGDTVSPERSREKMEAAIRQKTAYLWKSPAGEAMSMAFTTRQLPHGIGITNVYTCPEHRGKGCCQNAVATLCEELLRLGNEYCTLFVDQKNPISNRAYLRVGFVREESSWDYRIKEDEP